MEEAQALQHGKDGWLLVNYDYNEETGMARFLYRRDREHKTVNRQQQKRYFESLGDPRLNQYYT